MEYHHHVEIQVFPVSKSKLFFSTIDTTEFDSRNFIYYLDDHFSLPVIYLENFLLEFNANFAYRRLQT